jgi:autotransporter-associated beta strand protein
MKKTLLALITVFLALACATLGAPHYLTASAQSNTAPAISILSPTNDTVFNVSIAGIIYQIVYETNSTLSWVGYSLDGGGNVTVSGNNTYVGSTSIEERIENSGYNTLTLYANDTAGNWATPQTVTYLVEYYSDATSAAPVTSPTPSPSVPPHASLPPHKPTPSPLPSTSQLQTLTILTILALIILLLIVFIKRRITKN